jgi:hypothetical protein
MYKAARVLSKIALLWLGEHEDDLPSLQQMGASICLGVVDWIPVCVSCKVLLIVMDRTLFMVNR